MFLEIFNFFYLAVDYYQLQTKKVGKIGPVDNLKYNWMTILSLFTVGFLFHTLHFNSHILLQVKMLFQEYICGTLIILP